MSVTTHKQMIFTLLLMFCACSSRKDDDTAGLGEVSDKIEELVMASQNLPAVTVAIKELTDLAATQRVLLTAPKLQTIKERFSCVVCRSMYKTGIL